MIQELGTEPTQGRRRVHWVAAAFWSLVAVGSFIGGVTGQPAALVAAVLSGLYAAYLFRGGRFVLWIW